MASKKTQAVAPQPEAQPPAEVAEQRCGVTGSVSRSFEANTLRSVVRSVAVHPMASAEEREDGTGAAFAALRAFGPQNEIEAMIATQAIALHNAAIEALRRSTQRDLPPEVGSRLRRDGANLCRAMTDACEALDRRRGKGVHQRVVVERVTVQAGGQAVVGAVASPKGGMGDV